MSAYAPMRVAEVSSMTSEAGGGFAIAGFRSFSSRASSPPWPKRPWRTRALWSTREGAWELTVYPGHVNGWDPLCEGRLPEDGDGAKARELELCDGPRMAVAGWRDVDGTGGEAIPPYFARLGVRKPAGEVNVDATGEGVAIDGTPDDDSLPPRRYLKAADVWVAVARPTYRMVTTVTGNFLTGQLVDYSVTFDTGRYDEIGGRARMLVGPKMPERKRPDLVSRLNGLYEDESEDRRLISTVYWLSPPGSDGTPDWRWRTVARHATGWNLMHAAKNDPPKSVRQAGTDSYVAAFVGRYTIVPQATYGAMEAEAQRILNGVFNDTSNEGRFWTI